MMSDLFKPRFEVIELRFTHDDRLHSSYLKGKYYEADAIARVRVSPKTVAICGFNVLFAGSNPAPIEGSVPYVFFLS